jgi:protein disulfide-isomerase-like protein
LLLAALQFAHAPRRADEAAAAMLSSMRGLDYFKKMKADIIEQYADAKGNALGGTISVISVVLMIVLSLSSLRSYIAVYEQSEIALLMAEENSRIRISFNVTMDHLPCAYLSVDLKNVLGTKEMNISKNVQRYTVKHGEIDTTPKGRVKEQEHFHEEVHPSDPVHDVALGEGHVTLLTEETFKPWTRNPAHDAVWVNFFAPWCKWCKLLEPTWEKTAIELKSKEVHKVVLASVDCVASPALCQAHRIRGFPTLKVFHQSELSDTTYHGDRNVEKFVDYVNTVILSYKHMEDAKLKTRELARRALETGAHLGAQEGCNVIGFIEVDMVPGSLQITARSPEHDFAAHQLDMSHTVRRRPSFSAARCAAKFAPFPLPRPSTARPRDRVRVALTLLRAPPFYIPLHFIRIVLTI